MNTKNLILTILTATFVQVGLLSASDPIEPYLESGTSGQFRYAIYNNQWLLHGQQWFDEKHITRVAITGVLPEVQGKIAIPSSIKGHEVYGIDDNAFESCKGVTEIRLPKTVRFLRPGTLNRCDGLQRIVVAEDHPDFATADGVMFNKQKTKLLAFGSGRGGEYIIPSHTTEIGPNAFAGCTQLRSVIVPESVTDIGGHTGTVFSGCHSLERIELPATVTNIGQKSFQDCSNLTEVVIPAKVTTIPFGLFWKCSRLTTVVLPDGITSIGNYAFADCAQLTLEQFPKSLAKVGAYAFKDCKGLRGLTVPKSVVTIGRSAFRGSEVKIVNSPDASGGN
ncbi:MAG: leucine-rich repeat domain-containing protein [Rubripirellula sp.]|nr:leucine-rich repeat domain-containing protein [Rubripirellula sp.]